MKQRWTLNDIPWSTFQAAQVDPDLLALVKTAALVEANAADYVVYLRNVFADDPDFVAAAEAWGVEERQHGDALARWAEQADPQFQFARALTDFRRLYQLPLDVDQSIRGSRTGELIARQVVETGTSSFYAALRDASAEPVLKAVAGKIASDEYFHYRLFATHAKRYQRRTPLSLWARLKVAITRFNEAEDDELGAAYFAANVLHGQPEADFRAVNYGREYWRRAAHLYQRPHMDTVVRMVLRAVDLPANGRLFRLVAALVWRGCRWKSRSLAS